jgi:hypothetical protein
LGESIRPIIFRGAARPQRFKHRLHRLLGIPLSQANDEIEVVHPPDPTNQRLRAWQVQNIRTLGSDYILMGLEAAMDQYVAGTDPAAASGARIMIPATDHKGGTGAVVTMAPDADGLAVPCQSEPYCLRRHIRSPASTTPSPRDMMRVIGRLGKALRAQGSDPRRGDRGWTGALRLSFGIGSLLQRQIMFLLRQGMRLRFRGSRRRNRRMQWSISSKLRLHLARRRIGWRERSPPAWSSQAG